MKFGIQSKLLGALLPVTGVVIAAILLVVYLNTSEMMVAESEKVLDASTESVTNKVEAWKNETLTALKMQRDAIEYFDMEAEDELNYIRHTVNQYDAFPAGIYLAMTDGKLIHASFVPGPEYDLFAKPWYIDGLKSEEIVFGEVYFDEDSQSPVVGASGVLKTKSGQVRGVAAADIYLNAISQIVSDVQLQQTGGAFLADTGSGTLIGHKDTAMRGAVLGEQQNPLYTAVNGLLQNGATGLQTCEDESGGTIYVDLMPVPGTSWVTVSYVPQSEVMSGLNQLTRVIIGIAAAAILLLCVLIILIVRFSIVRPVKQLDFVARRIADGKLNEEITWHSKDEFGTLAANFNHTVTRLRDYVNYIDEVSGVLEEISHGNLVFKLNYEYTGEFAKMKDSLMHISSFLNDMMGRINQASVQVTNGSEQVAGGAQALSQGATEQASSVEELAATISEVSVRVRQNADSARNASEAASRAGTEVAESDLRMRDVIEAIGEISAQSSQIGKIIKTIEDIAFQTNILALNAAVEAARAGAAGKGFAVVADEVRNLAGKSAEAAKNTTDLIQKTINAVENGSRLAKETAEYMMGIVEDARQVETLVNGIAAASGEQAVSIAQINMGMEQISGVVQTNSATAEQSAAASEELSDQALLLKDLVGQFRLAETAEDQALTRV